MKKILQILTAAILIGGVYSCNGKNSEKPNQVNGDTSATRKDSVNNRARQVADTSNEDCDYYVDNTEAGLMIAKYNSSFYRNGHTRQFWIEKCAWSAVSNYLSSHQGYDGVRLFLSAVRGGGTFRSRLQIILTTPATSPTQTDRHTNQAGITIPLPSCTPSEIYMSLELGDALDKVNDFGSEFRGERVRGQRSSATIDPLSMSVWVSKCKIEKLMTLLNDVSTLNGLVVFAAAYYQDDQRRQDGYRKYVVQSTLILVPGTDRVPNWEVVQPPDKWALSGGFNHGELCPTICD